MSAEEIGRGVGILWARSGWITKILFFSGVGILVSMCASIHEAPSAKTTVSVAPTPPNPAIAAAKLKKEAAFQKTAAFAATLKQALRDPDSLVWEEIRANDDASIICLEYRARNGFGGMNKEIAVYANNKSSQNTSVWNKYCVQPLNDMKYVRQVLR